MKRFIFRDTDRVGDIVTLDAGESHHILKVLRLSLGTKIELIDGSDKVFSSEIIKTRPKVQARIEKTVLVKSRTMVPLHVGLGVIKVKNFELILQKCSELGVERVMPYLGSRSQGNFRQQYRAKEARWKKIAIDSCKQCLRTTPIHCDEIDSFESIIEQNDAILKILFWEKEQTVSLNDLRSKFASAESVMLLFGPEGGFTDDEIHQAREKGWKTVSLGELTLRTETAVIAATAITQHYLGNI